MRAGFESRSLPASAQALAAALPDGRARTLEGQFMHRRIPGSELIIYPDSGHGGIFQFHDQFAPAAVQFLDR